MNKIIQQNTKVQLHVKRQPITFGVSEHRSLCQSVFIVSFRHRGTGQSICKAVNSKLCYLLNWEGELNTAHTRDKRARSNFRTSRCLHHNWYLQTRQTFLVADTLVFNIVHRTVFINEHILKFLPSRLANNLRHLRRNVISSASPGTINSERYSDVHGNSPLAPLTVKIKVAKQLWLQPKSITPPLFSPLREVS